MEAITYLCTRPAACLRESLCERALTDETPDLSISAMADWVIDLRGLGRQPGSMQPLRKIVSSPERIGTEMIAVPEGAPVELDLRLESVTEGVLVSGTVSATAQGACRRCLDPLTPRVQLTVQELYAYPGSSTDETSDSEEIRRVAAEHVDLLPLVRDSVVLDLPLHPVCRSTCQGLCPGCGERLDGLPADHAHDDYDARWSALASLREELEQSEQDEGDQD